MKKMFLDKDGKPSGKRIMGFIILIAALAFTWFGKGDPEIVKIMFLSGSGAFAVTAFERKN